MKPLIYGHRGASDYAPENTMAAFYKALEQGVDGIEVDVQLTKDQEIVVIHDFAVDRTSNGKGMVKNYTLEELKRLDFGAGFPDEFAGEEIPTLEELLEFVQESGIGLNIEIKSVPSMYNKILIEKTNSLIQRFGLANQIIVSSFYHKSLMDLKAINNQIEIGLLYSGGLLNAVDYAKSVGAKHIHPHYAFIDEELVVSAKQNNIHINTWTVDDIDHVRQLVKMGVDIIITNKPDDVIFNMM